MNRNPWLENALRPLLVAGMIGAIAVSIVELARIFAPQWNGTYLILGAMLAALEAPYSYRLIQSSGLRGNDVLRFRLVELALFFILLKIGNYVGDSWAQILADIRTWSSQPLNVFDSETMLAFELALVSWFASTNTTKDLERIGEPPIPSRYYVSPIQSLTWRFFWGGMILLIVAGITRAGLVVFGDLSRPAVSGLVLNVLIYFLFGLTMLGQIHYIRLRQQWQAEEIEIAEGLTGRWLRYSLLFIGLATLAAFLLPTGYTLPILDLISILLGLLTYLAILIFQLFLFLFFLLMLPLALLIGAPPPTPPEPVSPPEIASPALGSGATPPWLEILRSVAFWAVLIGVVIYVVRSYLRDHPELLEALTQVRPIGWLSRLLTKLWRRAVGLAEVIGERIPRGLSLRRGRKKSDRPPFRFFRLGALSPRERIQYYFLSILRRAGQRGFPRQHSQTPREYDATLEPNLPEAQEEMGLLTQAFIEARYSEHALDKEEEKQVRADWKEVKAALRALRRAQEGQKAQERGRRKDVNRRDRGERQE